MILFRNFDFAVKYYDYELKTEITKTSNPRINGWYKYINEIFSTIFVMDNNIYFVYGENKILIKKSYKVFLEKRNETEYEFNVVEGNNILVHFCLNQNSFKSNAFPFEYIDEDDFRWGDFLARIINNDERKINFIANLME